MATMLDRINSLLEERDMRASHLAAELGLSNSYFTDWKKGKSSPALNTAIKIADYFRVSLDWLVYGRPENDIGKIQSAIDSADDELLRKYHSLTPELQGKLQAYLDGMLDTLHDSGADEKRLSS